MLRLHLCEKRLDSQDDIQLVLLSDTLLWLKFTFSFALTLQRIQYVLIYLLLGSLSFQINKKTGLPMMC